jgi:hypothetical protein
VKQRDEILRQRSGSHVPTHPFAAAKIPDVGKNRRAKNTTTFEKHAAVPLRKITPSLQRSRREIPTGMHHKSRRPYSCKNQRRKIISCRYSDRQIYPCKLQKLKKFPKLIVIPSNSPWLGSIRRPFVRPNSTRRRPLPPPP